MEEENKIPEGHGWCNLCNTSHPLDELRFIGGKYEKRCSAAYNIKHNSKNNATRNDHFSKKYPTPHLKCVYAIKCKEEFMYIGESEHTPWRMYEHLSGKGIKGFYKGDPEDLKSFSYEIMWHGDNDMKRKLMERVMIDKHQPKFNKQYKNG